MAIALPCNAMQGETMDLQGFSLSSEEVHFAGERQIGFWKPETIVHHRGGTPVASSSLDELQLGEHPEPCLIQHYKESTAPNLGNQASLSSNIWTYARSKSNISPPPYFSQVATNNTCSRYENCLFSSSLSELLDRKLRLSTNGNPYGHSVDNVTPHYEENGPFESLEEIEAQTIGNLLPDDDDLLFGVTDDELHYIVQPSNGDDLEDLDLFSSVGGMDLDDNQSYVGEQNTVLSEGISTWQPGGSSCSTPGEHPYGGHYDGEHPSRTLFVRNINSYVEETELRALFEYYGDIQTLHTECKHRGFVMISYYDLRAACNAMRALQNKPLRSRKLDIHFSIPKNNSSEKDVNQGTLVAFNLDSSVSNDELQQIFGVYGEIKKISETSHRIHHRIIDFYDIRAAEAAFRALNRIDIAGKQIMLEPSHSEAAKQCLIHLLPLELEQDQLLQLNSPSNNSTNGSYGSVPLGVNAFRTGEARTSASSTTRTHVRPFMKIPFHHWIFSSVPNSLPSSGHSHQYNESAFGSSGGNYPLPVHPYMWANSHQHRLPGMMWPNSPSLINGLPGAYPPSQMHGLPRAPSHMFNSVIPAYNRLVGSAPTVNPPLWNRRLAFVGKSHEVSAFHPGSLGSVRMSNNSMLPLECAPRNVVPHTGGNCPDPSAAHRNIGLRSPHQRCLMFPDRGQMLPMMSSFGNPNERTGRGRNENFTNQYGDKKQFELDIERIMQGDDVRTTLMLKNIPNKYTSTKLVAAIDELHKGTYDFIYLPIDFKNKCNVGYAFINVTDPGVIVSFYEAFNGKKWEKFNSEKVASLAYARIQGKEALVAHFQNSSLMNEDKRCLPILFHTNGPNAGDQEPFPVGANIRARPGKTRSCTNENYQGSSPILVK